MLHCIRNVISWTALIAGYAETNRPHEAFTVFRRMKVESVEPDERAMLAAESLRVPIWVPSTWGSGSITTLTSMDFVSWLNNTKCKTSL
ncbi:hypothetical protein ACFX13_034436 [Malus domestica]|uniref:Pentacotripeptide-repeat region of PRORP domain-containing protein n=1 Tax=Malus domestica TaxID=3750 RepID=A0A498KA34_MALDO|nr:hypothetical protein DVH24_030362 [Malus domestica]